MLFDLQFKTFIFATLLACGNQTDPPPKALVVVAAPEQTG
jgi:hypothetical protein